MHTTHRATYRPLHDLIRLIADTANTHRADR